MKYIEEIKYGDTFRYNSALFVLTSTFKENGSKLGINLTDGNPKWFAGSDIITIEPIYFLDTDNNIVCVKIESNEGKITTVL